MLHLLHTASCYQRYLHLPIDWQQVQSVDVLNLICQLVACCQLPVAVCGWWCWWWDCCCWLLWLLLLPPVAVAVTVAVVQAAKCQPLGNMLGSPMNVKHIGPLQMSAIDRQCTHTNNTPTHTHSNTHSDHTHLAHFAGVALVLVMLPAACCCQRPDWPGKRQIRRTIALDFYLSNVYGSLAGQPVAQSSEPTPATHTHYTTQLCSAYSLIKQFFFTIFTQQPHFLWYPINFNAYACLRSDIGAAIQAILRYYYAPFAQGSAIFWLTPVTLITWADETIIINSTPRKILAEWPEWPDNFLASKCKSFLLAVLTHLGKSLALVMAVWESERETVVHSPNRSIDRLSELLSLAPSDDGCCCWRPYNLCCPEKSILIWPAR